MSKCGKALNSWNRVLIFVIASGAMLSLSTQIIMLYNQYVEDDIGLNSDDSYYDALGDHVNQSIDLITSNKTNGFRDVVSSMYPRPESCVYNCSNTPTFVFDIPNGSRCHRFQTCKFTRYAALHHKQNLYVVYDRRVQVRCSKDKRRGYCKFRNPGECKWDGWLEWKVEYRLSRSVSLDKRYYSAQYFPTRPFLINSMYNTSTYPGYMQVVSYFQPSSLFQNLCNQMYCFYEYPDGQISRYAAIHGDISFVFCPYPKKHSSSILSDVRLRLSYDQIYFSSPHNVSLTQVPGDLPYVSMSLCTIVKKEGVNLMTWAVYHIMQGYERIILYDNNDDGFVDEEMELFIEKMKNIIVRVRWPFMHSQSEQCTDCILRFGSRTKWMTFIDVDEFVVPHDPESTMNILLNGKYRDYPILQSDWVVFGPCRKEKLGPEELIMEICNKVYDIYFPLPKSTFQPEYVAGMQSIGPHFPRLKKDLGKNLRSNFLKTTDVSIYHYRFRTLSDYMERRLGPVADRIIVHDENSLMLDWNQAVKESRKLPPSKNYILHYIPRLKKQLFG